MRKKLLILGLISVLMLLTTSFVSAVGVNVEKKDVNESPLYKLRIDRSIREKIGKIYDTIKTKFLGERLFFIPSKFKLNLNMKDSLGYKSTYCTMYYPHCFTWWPLPICDGKMDDF